MRLPFGVTIEEDEADNGFTENELERLSGDVVV